MPIQTINPATAEIIHTYTETPSDQIYPLLQQVNHAQTIWQCFSFNERRKKMLEVAKILEKNGEQYAKQISLEMGKPITLSRAEIKKCQWVCEHYANQAENYLSSHSIQTDFYKSYVTYQPIGVIFAIMPWNFPFWQVFRFAAPNVMAGNACVLKHAEIVTGCGLLIEKIFQEAGFPDNLFRVVLVNHEHANDIIQHELIKAVTLTGSERAGSSVAMQAGKALKKVVLELGGNDPYLILADADLEHASEQVVQSRMNNTGQVCIAAKRVIAVQSIHDALRELIAQKIKNYHMGDPLNESTRLGPLARDDLRNTVHQQVLKSIQQGAQLFCGGYIPEQPGFYYPPTILTQVSPGMPAFDEEIFGPVISIISAKNEEEGIKLANHSRFGLTSAVFTQDIKKGEEIARNRIETGTCCVNSLVRSDPRLPFGGIKSSGFGRELSAEGIREFTNIKTICVNPHLGTGTK